MLIVSVLSTLIELLEIWKVVHSIQPIKLHYPELKVKGGHRSLHQPKALLAVNNVRLLSP